MHTSASSVMFIPHNFHDRDPSRDTAQGVLIELEQGKEANPRYYGGMHHNSVMLNMVRPPRACLMPKAQFCSWNYNKKTTDTIIQTQLEPDLSRYRSQPPGVSTSDIVAKGGWIGMGIAP